MNFLKSLLCPLILTVSLITPSKSNQPETRKPASLNTASRGKIPPRLTVALQPLGPVDSRIINSVRLGIQRLYNAEVTVLPEQAMPASTLNKATERYRAEKLLPLLDRGSRLAYTKVLALTNLPISTTNGRHPDWNISGLGLIGKRPCVVTSYNIIRKKGPRSLFYDRIVKIANHELGHTFGLTHCSNSSCLMADMQGTLRVLDKGDGALCSRCRQQLQPYLSAP